MRTFSIVAAIALLCGAVSAPQAQDAPLVAVHSCILGLNAKNIMGVSVTFVNNGPEPLTTIAWRVRIDNGWVDIFDHRRAATGQELTHTVYSRVFVWGALYRDDPTMCSAVETISARDAEWSAPGFSTQHSVSKLTKRPDDATPVPASIDNPARDPVGIVACEFSVWRRHGVLEVRFRNLAATTIDRVVFRGAYMSGGFDFTFGGSFAPGVLISSNGHYVGAPLLGRLTRILPVDVPFDYDTLSDAPSNCTTISVHFVDGSEWHNPVAGPTEPPMPTAPPTLPPN